MPDAPEERPPVFHYEQRVEDPAQLVQLLESLNPILQRIIELRTTETPAETRDTYMKFTLNW